SPARRRPDDRGRFLLHRQSRGGALACAAACVLMMAWAGLAGQTDLLLIYMLMAAVNVMSYDRGGRSSDDWRRGRWVLPSSLGRRRQRRVLDELAGAGVDELMLVWNHDWAGRGAQITDGDVARFDLKPELQRRIRSLATSLAKTWLGNGASEL